MTDRELRKEFIRIERSEEKVEIFVREIRWDGPHTPVFTWAIGKTLADMLQDHRYFRVCDECGERKPLGWMLNGSLCQECAQANHGVVY